MFQLSEQNLGGRDLDVSIAKRLAEKLEHEQGINVKSDPKAWLKLMMAVNKARNRLSIDTTAQVNVENLYGSTDFYHSVTQAEFREWVSPQLTKFRDFMNSVANLMADLGSASN